MSVLGALLVPLVMVDPPLMAPPPPPFIPQDVWAGNTKYKITKYFKTHLSPPQSMSGLGSGSLWDENLVQTWGENNFFWQKKCVSFAFCSIHHTWVEKGRVRKASFWVKRGFTRCRQAFSATYLASEKLGSQVNWLHIS